MGGMVPKELDVVTSLEFCDGENRYLQNYQGQLDLREGQIIRLRGDFGNSNCRLGEYRVSAENVDAQLTLDQEAQREEFYFFYRCDRVEGPS